MFEDENFSTILLRPKMAINYNVEAFYSRAFLRLDWLEGMEKKPGEVRKIL